MLVKLLARVILVALAFLYITPYVAGVRFEGNFVAAVMASVLFNLAFWGLECLLAVVVFGINIGTLGLGAILTGSVKFVAALISPSVALWGVSRVLPHAVHVSNPFPGALVYGLMLGGLLWASIPENKGKA